MQDSHQAHLTANKARVTSQMLHGGCGSTKKQIINQSLMAAGHFPETAGQGEGQ
jgi:hypothetical protein